MKKVLLMTLGLTLIAAIISGLVYFPLFKKFDKEIVEIISVLALLTAIPVVLGYLIAHFSLIAKHFFWDALKVLLFLINGGLIITATILTLLFGSEEGLAFIGLPYIIAGSYTYYETIKLLRMPPSKNAQTLSNHEDVLDDFFLDDHNR